MVIESNVRCTGKVIPTNREGKTWNIIGATDCGKYYYISFQAQKRAPEVRMIRASDYAIRDRLNTLPAVSDKSEEHYSTYHRNLRNAFMELWGAMVDGKIREVDAPQSYSQFKGKYLDNLWIRIYDTEIHMTQVGKERINYFISLSTPPISA